MGLWHKFKRGLRTWLRQRLLNLLNPLDCPTIDSSGYPPETLKTLKQRYEFEIKLKNQEIKSLQSHNQDLLDIINIMAENPTPNINASGGSFVNTGNMDVTGSTVNLGEISGTVTNTLQQLQGSTEPGADTLVTLLQELQTQITQDPELDDKSKAKALKHLDTLGKLAVDRQNSDLRDMAETAWDALSGLVGKAVKLAPLAAPLLQQIQTLLGL